MTGIGFHPEARAELLASVAYYEDQAEGLGRQFTDEVERVVQLVAEQPGFGAPIGGTKALRRWTLRQFPYYLIYRSEPNALLVLAVAHQRRRPGYWKARSS